jgi:hypothetical protein
MEKILKSLLFMEYYPLKNTLPSCGGKNIGKCVES